ncbi:hypothetical protein BGW80DRAFT_1269025 [Lactifluus volemus]|nr:hypothetical protein BGW80DRAFT_1269025 [Lactifluus volemus]
MVIDVKLPPEDPQPLNAPPPAYAPSSETASEPSHNASHLYQQYPPSTTQPGPWNAPPQGTQTMAADGWSGQPYRTQQYARCASGEHEPTTSFGLCGIICAIFLFPIGLIFLCIDSEQKCARCGLRLPS